MAGNRKLTGYKLFGRRLLAHALSRGSHFATRRDESHDESQAVARGRTLTPRASHRRGPNDGQEAEAALVDAVATGALGVLRVDDARRVARFDGAAPAFASEQQVAAELHAAVAAVLDVGATAAAMAERVALNPNFILKSDLVTAEAHVDRDDGHADVDRDVTAMMDFV